MESGVRGQKTRTPFIRIIVYTLANIPLPDSSKMRSVVASKNAPMPDSVANWSEPSSPNFSETEAMPLTVTLLSPS